MIRFGRNLGEKEEAVAAADMNCTLVSLQEITLVEEEHSKAILKVALVAAIATYQTNPSCCCCFFFFFHHSRDSCTLQSSSLKLLPDQRVDLLADICSQSSNSLYLSLSLSLSLRLTICPLSTQIGVARRCLLIAQKQEDAQFC
jgi:hypothetical protein